MDNPPQQLHESSPPQAQLHANNHPECNAMDLCDVDAVGTPATPAIPALPGIDGFDFDVDGAARLLLETPAHITEPNPSDLSNGATATQDWQDNPIRHPDRVELQSPSKVYFPSKIPEDITRFTNFDESKFDEGFDSEGEQCFFADELIVDDPDFLSEEAICPSAQPPAEAPSAPAVLTEEAIKKFNVARLKDELKKRGRPVSGSKAVLVQRLVEAVQNNVPVSATAVVRDASMANLDVTACWNPLTINPLPVPEPINIDGVLRPQTEMDAPITQKYEFNETFDRIPFLGDTKDMTLSHMPVIPPGKKSGHICQLHRWANNFDNRKGEDNKMPSGSRHNVCHCKTCEVNLCLHCYEIFHTKADLEGEISTILGNRNDRKKPRKVGV